MPYEPPPGSVERRVYPASDPAVDEKERLRFRLRPDCTLVEAPEHLMAVDRPYSEAPVQPMRVGLGRRSTGERQAARQAQRRLLLALDLPRLGD